MIFLNIHTGNDSQMSDRLARQLVGSLCWILRQCFTNRGQYLGYFNPGKKFFFCFRVLHHDCQIEAEIRNVGKWMARVKPTASGLERFARQSKFAVPGSDRCSQTGGCLLAPAAVLVLAQTAGAVATKGRSLL